MSPYILLSQTEHQWVSDAPVMPILRGCEPAARRLALLLPQLGDFESLEYASGYSGRPNDFRHKAS